MDRHWLITCTAVFSHVSPQDTAAAIVYEQKHFALIVVDERLIGKLLAKTLKSSGYQICDMVASGEEVIAVAKKEKLDAIVTDIILMGEMDDFEAASIIQEEHSVPVVFLTCFNDEEPPEGPVKSIDLR